MFNISGFLDKFVKNLHSKEDDLKIICQVIFDVTDIECPPDSITIKNNTLFLKISPGAKNKVFMYKTKLLEYLEQKTKLKILDIR